MRTLKQTPSQVNMPTAISPRLEVLCSQPEIKLNNVTKVVTQCSDRDPAPITDLKSTELTV
jgi:hypothetical protein